MHGLRSSSKGVIPVPGTCGEKNLFVVAREEKKEGEGESSLVYGDADIKRAD